VRIKIQTPGKTTGLTRRPVTRSDPKLLTQCQFGFWPVNIYTAILGNSFTYVQLWDYTRHRNPQYTIMMCKHTWKFPNIRPLFSFIGSIHTFLGLIVQ